MASKHREEKVIKAVACTTCGAAQGEPCRQVSPDAAILATSGRLFVCSERRLAWQLVRDGDVKDGGR